MLTRCASRADSRGTSTTTLTSEHHSLCMPCCILYDAAQSFEGADFIMHELGDNVALSDFLERPAAVQDDRLVSSRFGI